MRVSPLYFFLACCWIALFCTGPSDAAPLDLFGTLRQEVESIKEKLFRRPVTVTTSTTTPKVPPPTPSEVSSERGETVAPRNVISAPTKKCPEGQQRDDQDKCKPIFRKFELPPEPEASSPSK